jgi:adenosine deaminase
MVVLELKQLLILLKELECKYNNNNYLQQLTTIIRKLPSYDEDELRKILVVNDDCQSLEDYLRAFQYTCAVMQDEVSLERCMFEVCQDAYNDGVRYLEVRFGPNLHIDKGLSTDQVIKAVIRGREKAEAELPNFHVRIIVCGLRNHDKSAVLEMAKLVEKYKNHGVVAFDIAGPEHGFRPEIHQNAFDFVRENLLHCTVHAGEADNSVRSALKVGAQRIGHGVRVRHDNILRDYMINCGIPVEMCLTSNVQTRAVKGFEDHPIYEFHKRGMIVVPCTDNTLISGITLTQEYEKLQHHFEFDKHDVAQLLQNGFAAAFNTNFAQKKKIEREAREEIRQILNL